MSNAKIFGIDEHCNLKFEFALLTNCKTYIIFFYSGGPSFFSFYFLSPLFSHSCIDIRPFLSLSLSLSLLDIFASLSNETQAGAPSQADLYRSDFFSFLFCCDLMVDSAIVVWVVGRHFGSAFSALSFTLYSAFSAYQTLL